MKRFLIPILIILFQNNAIAQAVLPTSWDVTNTTNPPAGWTFNNSNSGSLIYTANGFFNSTPQAFRLDAASEYVQCFYGSKSSTIEFYVRHTGSVSPFPGEFSVEESSNGTNWTVLKKYTTDLPGTITKLTLTPNSNSRYIRWTLVTKPTGYNVSVDDMVINAATGGINPEIQVAAITNTNQINKNANIYLGNNTPNVFYLTNKSTNAALIIDSVVLSGTDKSFFQLGTLPTSIASKATSSFNLVSLNTGSNGTKNATLTIYSNDKEGNAQYAVNLEAVKGTLANEPTASVTSLAFSSIKPWRLKTSWVNPVSASGVLVLTSSSSITAAPTDGQVYEKGAYIGNARIAYVGSLQQTDIDQVIANSNYFVKVFPYQGQTTFINYKTNNEPQINVTSPGSNIGNYYGSIDPKNASFVSTIRSKINPHFQIFYSNYTSTLVDNFEAYDTTSNNKVLTCYYSGFKYIFTPPFIWNVMSREHSYPSSYMGESSDDSACYSDLHILFPTNQNNANSIRSNYPLGNVVTTTFTFLAGKLGKDSAGTIVYEPMTSTKGIVARANFYACAAYHTNSKKFTLPTSNQFVSQFQNQAILKKWNKQYPPSNREIARHEYIASVQNNRNPFIDNPTWACYIDFSRMTHLPNGCDSSSSATLIPIQQIDLSVFPNPSNGTFKINCASFKQNELKLSIYNITEQVVFEQSVSNTEQVINPNINAGTYLLVVKSKNQISAKKLVIN